MESNDKACVFCLNSGDNYPGEEIKRLLERELNVIFIVRKLLSLSSAECEGLLEKFGCPSTWLTVCDQCMGTVNEARNIFNRICELEKQLEGKRNEMKRKIVASKREIRIIAEVTKESTLIVRRLVLQHKDDLLDKKWDVKVKEEQKVQVKSESDDEFLIPDSWSPSDGYEDRGNAPNFTEISRSKSKLKHKKTKKTKNLDENKAHENQSLKCAYCVLRFENFSLLSSHTRVVHWIYNPGTTSLRGLNHLQTRRGKKCPKCPLRLPLDVLRNHCLEKHDMLPCPKCPRLFIEKSSRTLHLLNVHKELEKIAPKTRTRKQITLTAITDEINKPYNCLHCSYRAKLKVGLRRHIERMHKNLFKSQETEPNVKKTPTVSNPIHVPVGNVSLHQCLHCNYCCKSKSSVKMHMLTMHKDLYLSVQNSNDNKTEGTNIVPFITCEKCPLNEENRFESVEAVNNHKVEKHNMLKCDKCRYVCTGLGYLENHQLAYHSAQAAEASNWMKEVNPCGRAVKQGKLFRSSRLPQHRRCEYCEKVFPSLDLREKHILEAHPENTLKCEKCPEVFGQLKSLYFHKTRVHNEPDNPYRCPDCNYSNDKFRAIHVHREKMHGGNPGRVVCELCSDTFANENYLAYHKNIKHGLPNDKTKHTCGLCARVFTSPAYLKVHIRTRHMGQWRFKCPHCGIGFVGQKQCDLHVAAVHDKIYPFVCTVEGCDRKYVASHRLKQHIARMHAPKNFKCSLCDYAHAIEIVVKRHEEEVHNKTQTYQCDLCGKVYNIKRSLQQHLRVTHKIRKGRGKQATLTPFAATFNKFPMADKEASGGQQLKSDAGVVKQE